MSSPLSRELVFLIIQHLEEENFEESAHMLEQESGFFFNMEYFEKRVLAREWDEAEKYLSSFTKLDDNSYSLKTFFEIKKQKYLDAFDNQHEESAVDILANELKAFVTFDEDLRKETAMLLILRNFRKIEWISKYINTKPSRSNALIELKKLIESNPLLREKLVFPSLKPSRLGTLINQSLNWQHLRCQNPKPNPDIKTLFDDHACPSPNESITPTPPAAKPEAYTSLGDNGGTYPVDGHHQASFSLEDIPTTVAFTLHQGSAVNSLDFHPSLHTLLLVGCSNGEITLWESGRKEKLCSMSFEIWDIQASTLPFQASAAKETPFSVNRVIWSPDGTYCGAAFSKHLVHLYNYAGPNDLRQHIEIDAHEGGVNDIAFAHPNNQHCVVTCGDDKLIKVWDFSGRKIFNFEGHEAPVYSIHPHQKATIKFILSTDVDGKIRSWMYDDNMGSEIKYDAPGHWCTTMLYSANGTRLFSCGTGKDGNNFLVEWNQYKGVVERIYTGFRKKSPGGVAQFDAVQNRFLAVGEDKQIKFWDMDNVNVLASTDAGGDLPSFPRLRFNKEGYLLAVTTADDGIKILANASGFRALRAVEARPSQALRSPLEAAAAMKKGVDSISKTIEISEAAQCRMVTMPDSNEPANKVARLLYTNSGNGLLALGSNGIQKLWKWARNEQNRSGKATASIVPQRWKPNTGLVMANDVSGVNLEEAALPCIALPRNDSYVISAAGGRVSLFNMLTFRQVLKTFMTPPPASTFLAFHPQDNNIIAIGTEDSTIHIYHVMFDEVRSVLKGHQNRITGLAFSTKLNVLASSGADAQLFLWSIGTWEKRKSVLIQLPAGKKAPNGDILVQFHSDQVHLLVAHETQIAIYDASKMECINRWAPQEYLSAPVSCASYSCNSQLVFATFRDGNIRIFDADTLILRCRIAPSAYLTRNASNGSQVMYPEVVAAHPQEPYQLAVGLTDGSVVVIEPSESDSNWGVSPPSANGVVS